jgi:hypothetical protein
VPLPYSTITLTPIGTADTVAKFTDGAGQTVFVGLARGQYHLRARDLGFHPGDTVVVVADASAPLAVTLRLREIPHLMPAIYVRTDRGCRHPGLPDSAAAERDSLALLANLIRENADRVRLFTAAYPFYYQREAHFTEQATPKAAPQTILVDTATYDSRLHPGYHEGHLVRVVRGPHGKRTRVFVLPTLVDLADPAFERVHCFWYAGRDSGDAGVTIKFDVEPLITMQTPDAAAEFSLDGNRYLVRRATFQLTHPDRIAPRLKRETVETHYRELAPLVAIADSVVTTTLQTVPYIADGGDASRVILDDRWRGDPRTIVEEEHLIGVWDASGQVADTSSLGMVADTGAGSDTVFDAPAASVGPATAADIRGRLIGPDGEPVPGAHVEIIGFPSETVSGDSGQFELHSVPPGDETLLIRRIGFRPTIASLPAKRSASRRIIVQLPASSVVILDPVVVTAQRVAAAYQRIGFDTRRKTRRGFFLDADQIAAFHAAVLRELLARAPGFQWVHGTGVTDTDAGPVIPFGTLRVEGDVSCLNAPPGRHDHVVGDDPSCSICIEYFVDGRRFLADEHLAALNADAQVQSRYPPKSIAAIEVYPASAAPAGLTSEGTPGCAAVVIWTKRYLGI